MPSSFLKERTRLLFSIIIMVVVTLMASSLLTFFLYKAALEEQRNWLTRIVDTQTQLIEAVGRFDAMFSTNDHPGGAWGATLSQISFAYRNYDPIGDSGELVFGRMVNDTIQFLQQSEGRLDGPPLFLPITSQAAEPMRRALSGETGSIIGLDYDGTEVLAAYQPIDGLGLGIVAKIDMAEIRAPFIAAGVLGSGIATVVVLLGIYAIWRTTIPIVKDLEKANAAKSEFLAAMSHDLRTPLNAIMGFSDIFRHETFGPLGNERYKDYAADIYNSGTLLVSLINDVLDISKIEAGRYDLIEEPVDLSEIIDISLHQLQPAADTARQTLNKEIPKNFPQMIGDETALIQIVNNLVSNAIKFTPEEGKITVSGRVDISGRINLSFTDNGIGMSAEGVEKALKPFEQADSRHSRRHQGTGLGLHLCANFMKLFGGKLTIESAPGFGTTVNLQFPASRTISSDRS